MKTIQRMYDYVCWANDYLLDTIHQSEDNPELLRLFSHILFSERVWIKRMNGEDTSGLEIWANVDYDRCKELVAENKELVDSFISQLTEEKLVEPVDYTTRAGQNFTNTVEEIVNHVALHGQYHRGQINLKIRELGYEPVNVDFITFIRK